jgi:hypothetical protein
MSSSEISLGLDYLSWERATMCVVYGLQLWSIYNVGRIYPPTQLSSAGGISVSISCLS